MVAFFVQQLRRLDAGCWMQTIFCVFTVALLLTASSILPSESYAVSQSINIQGKVTNTNGTNVADGVYDFVFKLYDGAGGTATNTFTESWTSAALWSSTMTTAPASGGTSLTYSSNTNEATIKPGQLLWNTTKQEAVKVVAVNTATNVVTISATAQAWTTSDTITNRIYVKDGIFQVALNSLNQNWGTTDFNQDLLHVGINFNSDGEMKPRSQLNSVAYAFRAQSAATVDGLSITGGKSVAFQNSITYGGADGSTVNFGSGGTVCYTSNTCVQDDALDFDKLMDSMTLDASTNFAIGSGLVLSTSGLGDVAFSHTGKTTFAGNVGIGVNTPGARLTIQSNSDVATLGPELVTNGAFDSSSSWSFGLGWTYNSSSGQADHAGGATNNLSQTISLKPYTMYEISYTVSSRTAGSITPVIGGVNGPATSSNTTDSPNIITSFSPSNQLAFTPSSDFDGSIDNVSVREVLASTPILVLNNSTGNAGLEIRIGEEGSESVYIGVGSGKSVQAGIGLSNTALGYGTLESNSWGRYNVAMGRYTLYGNIGGYSNTAIGDNTLSSNTYGNHNTAIADGALLYNTTGNDNTAIGVSAGFFNETGNRNVFIGYQAGFYETGSDTLYIANSDTTTPLIKGDFAASLLTVNGKLTATNGLEVVGESYFAGNVGIGVSSPAAKLEVKAGNLTQIGPELATNGTFDTDASGWSLGTCSSYAAGHVTTNWTDWATCDYPQISTSIATQAGKTYAITLDVVATGDTVYLMASNNYLNFDEGLPTGTHTVYFTAGATATEQLSISLWDWNSGASYSIDNVSVKEVIAPPALRILDRDGVEVLQLGGVGALDNLALGRNALASNTNGTDNLALGSKALNLNTTGYNNVGLGSSALSSNTAGLNNVAVGVSALALNSTGSDNLALGTGALSSNTAGLNNVAVGSSALALNSTGSDNVAVGLRALNGNSTGSTNVAIGSWAGYSNTSGAGNVFIGNRAGYNETGSNTLYIANSDTATPLIKGDFAASLLTVNGKLTATNGLEVTGDSYFAGNVGIGTNTPGAKLAVKAPNLAFGPQLVTNGSFDTDAAGWELGACASWSGGKLTITYSDETCSGPSFSTPTFSTEEGKSYEITYDLVVTGDKGVASPHYAAGWFPNLQSGPQKIRYTSDFTGSEQIAFMLTDQNIGATMTIDNVSIKEVSGQPALSIADADGTAWLTLGGLNPQQNLAFGPHALEALVAASENTAIGIGVLASTTTGDYNTGLGFQALGKNTSGWQNTGLGNSALYSNTTGQSNTAVGIAALFSNTTGYSNAALGASALYSNTTGYSNTALGTNALSYNTTGIRNVGLGVEANYFNETGSNGVYIGYQAGRGIAWHNKSGNVFIGYQAGYNESGSNLLYIANSNTATPLIKGDFAASLLTVNGVLTATNGLTLSDKTVNGGILYTNGSGVVAQSATGTSGQCLQSAGGGAPVWGSCGSGGSIAADSLNFTDLSDSLTLDASTDIAIGSGLTFSTSGVGKMAFNHTGDSTFVGNVGIGVNNPNAKLAVAAPTMTEIGPELISNGTFDTDAAGWGLTSCGTWTAGHLSVTYTDGCGMADVQTTIETVAGKTYKVSFDVTVSGDTVQSNVSSEGQEWPIFTSGSRSYFVTATTTDTKSLHLALWQYNEGASFTVDNVSVKEVTAPVTAFKVQSGDGYTLLSLGDNLLGNTAIGKGALQSNPTGDSNSALGFWALAFNTSGNNNNAIGKTALALNTTGSNNNAIGYEALFSNTTGDANNAIGSMALWSNTTGWSNTAIGDSAMQQSINGDNNVAIGDSAGMNFNGSYNVAIGAQSGMATEGSGNIFIGYRSGFYETGSNTLYIANSDTTTPLIKGDFAASLLTVNGKLTATNGLEVTGESYFAGNVGIGVNTPGAKLAVQAPSLVTGTELVSNGAFNTDASGWTLGDCASWSSGKIIITDSDCSDRSIVSPAFATESGKTYQLTYDLVATGDFGSAFPLNSTGYFGPINTGSHKDNYVSTFTGMESINFESYNWNPGAVLEVDNVSVREVSGAPTMQLIDNDGAPLLTLGGIQQSENLAMGRDALKSLTSGRLNVGVGIGVLSSTTNGRFNTGLGAYALAANTTGDSNTALGNYALYANTTGWANIGVGYQALLSNLTGNDNIGLGYSTLYSNTSGWGNIGLGSYALFYNATGNNNIGLGYSALNSNIGGSNNVAIGPDAGRYTTGSGNVFIGYRAGYFETGSDMLYIANSNTSTPLIYGDFSSSALTINGSLAVTGVTKIANLASSSDTTEGALYYDSDDDQLKVYANGKWQADRSSVTKIVAASDSQNKEKADFVADGTADDAEIQAAINALPASGGSVVLLEGTYAISSTINLNKDGAKVSGQGYGTLLNRTSAGDIFNIIGTSLDRVTDVTLANMRFTGPSVVGTQVQGAAIEMDYTDRVSIEQVWASGFGSLGDDGAIMIKRSTTCTVKDSRLSASKNGIVTGVATDASYEVSHCSFIHNEVFSNYDDGIHTQHAKYATISGNHVYDNGTSGGDSAGIDTLGDTSDTITGNVITGTTQKGIEIGNSTSAGGYDNGHTISGNTVNSNGQEGILVGNNAKNITIANNTTMNNGTHGILLGTSNAAKEVVDSVVIGNTAISNGTDGIRVTGNAHRNLIKDNQLLSNSNRGITVTFASTEYPKDNIIEGNRFAGNTVAQFSDVGIRTIFRFNQGATADILYANASAAPTADMFTIANTSAGTSTTGVDGLQIDFATSGTTASATNSGLQINVTSNNSGATTTLYGLNIGDLSSAEANATEIGLHIGANWDYSAVFDGLVGIGTATPSAQLHVSKSNGAGDVAIIIQNSASTVGETASVILRTTSGSNAAGSISAERIDSNNAKLHLSTIQAGVVTKALSIDNTGTVTMAKYTANGGVLYTNASGVIAQTTAGTSGQCLQSVGGGAPVWGSCGSGGITGSGTSGQLAFWNGTSSQSGDSNLSWDNTSKQLTIGTSGNAITLSSSGLAYAGTARATKIMTLSPEFQNTTFTTEGSASTNGNMITDNTNSSSTGFRNYYEWSSTQGTLQEYTIAVRITLPQDFDTWDTTGVSINYQTGTALTADNAVSAKIYESSQTTPACDLSTDRASTTWTTSNMTCAETTLNDGSNDWDTAGQTAIIKIKVKAKNTASALTRVGEIVLRYKAKF